MVILRQRSTWRDSAANRAGVPSILFLKSPLHCRGRVGAHNAPALVPGALSEAGPGAHPLQSGNMSFLTP